MNWLSGGVLFAVGAALWVAYLLPSMLRRRQLQAAEFEAATLHHALHTLASTGELPVAEPSARESLQERKRQDKLERQVERENLKSLHEAEEQRKAEAKQARIDARHSDEARRVSLKRGRTAAAWLLLLSLLTIVGGGVVVFFGVTWMIAGAGAMGAVLAVVLLRGIVRSLAALSPAQVRPAAQSTSTTTFTPVEMPVTTPSRRWTPQPLPSPLHLAEGSSAAATIATNESLEALRRRAREVAAASAEPSLPTVTAARLRAQAMAAHPASYGAARRAAMRNQHVAAQGSAQASARSAAQPVERPRTRAELVAARYASVESFEQIEVAAFDVQAVLQRRRAS